MRRPYPRFDDRRNAWVTRAGGKLKTLAQGPKNAETEAAAWDAFYVHMARLSNPVPNSEILVITLGELADRFGEWMEREVDAGRNAQGTLDYYRWQLQPFIDTVGGNRPALGILPHEVGMFKKGWHSVQAVQRLYNWGVEMGLLKENPFSKIKKPPLGARERILDPAETIHVLRAADRVFRPFLFAQRHTIARPQEIRAFQWKHLPSPGLALSRNPVDSSQTGDDTSIHVREAFHRELVPHLPPILSLSTGSCAILWGTMTSCTIDDAEIELPMVRPAVQWMWQCSRKHLRIG